MIFVIDSGIAGDIGGLACLKAGRKICKCGYRVHTVILEYFNIKEEALSNFAF